MGTSEERREKQPERVLQGDGRGDRAALDEVQLEDPPEDGEHRTGLEGWDHPPEEESAAEEERAFGVVGVGASAGGLDSIRRFLEAVPANTGLAFVIVQHLDPTQESLMVDLLTQVTAMPVLQAYHDVLIEPNHVYVMPPGATMMMAGGRLALEPRVTRGQSMPIDLFLRSLAIERRSRAVAVILSGTGTDGTLALKAIKGECGIAFAESEDSAKFADMPRSAAGSGNVDAVLPARALGQEIAAIAPRLQGAYTRAELEAGVGGDREVRRILSVLRSAKGVDFSLYRQTTLRRRIIRRMLLHKLHTVAEYLALLKQQPREVDELYQDVLIRVTAFFRDPGVHEALKKQVFPALLRDRQPDQAVRIWVPGCATGEEAYSLAIGLVECMTELKKSFPVQIFATDVSEVALEQARAGIYIENIALDLSPERLRRFFIRVGKTYQISKSIREMCVFARQDMTSDPPFSRLDLISCRNVLIYIEPVMQRRVLTIFHYALKSSGFLVLGHSESTSSTAELFRVVDRPHKIFTRAPVPARVSFDFPSALHAGSLGVTPPKAQVARLPEEPIAQTVQREADRLVMARYAPAGVIVTEDMHVVQFRGQTGQYLEPAPGEPTFNLLKMARPPLAMELRTAVHKAQKTDEPVRCGPIEVRAHGADHTVMVQVLPLRIAQREERPVPGGRHFLIEFEEVRSEAPRAPGALPGGRKKKAAAAALSLTPAERRELARMKQELAATREHMQSIIEELEAVNEELQSANEEILSSNEELQSINEELETAKEELQSTNEELTTVNEELRTRNLELTQVNNDLNNSLSSVNLPIVMLGTDLRIRRFTPMAERALNLIPTDVGRPISDIRPRIQMDDLEACVTEVIETMRPFQRDVRDREGRWYSIRIRPYRTSDNKIEGAVLALVDIDESKRALTELQGMYEYVDTLLGGLDAPLCVLDTALRVRSANGPFHQLFRTTPQAARGRLLLDLGHGPWSGDGVRSLLEGVLSKRVVVRDHPVEHDLPGVGRRSMRLNARPIPRPGDGPPEGILLSFELISDA